MSENHIVDGIVINAPVSDAHAAILTPGALAFIRSLSRQFETRRRELMARREKVQSDIDGGQLPDFLPETKAIRDGEWTVAPVPADLSDRRVEITGPVDRKMVINALNSGAKTYMADFEDSHSPTWAGTIDGQINLRDAVNQSIDFTNPAGKRYRLNDQTATLIVRPRGWHLWEEHVLLDGEPIPGAIFDFGLYLFHNAAALRERGTGPYFYLPKLENHLEARLWNDVFVAAQDALGVGHVLREQASQTERGRGLLLEGDGEADPVGAQ